MNIISDPTVDIHRPGRRIERCEKRGILSGAQPGNVWLQRRVRQDFDFVRPSGGFSNVVLRKGPPGELTLIMIG